jgi:hypothetical protein
MANQVPKLFDQRNVYAVTAIVVVVVIALVTWVAFIVLFPMI